jgi:transposase-like protein
MESRRTYSYEYKINIINKILNKNESISKIAEKYLLNKSMLFRWIKEYKNSKNETILFPGHGKKYLNEKNEIIKEAKLLIKNEYIRKDLYNFIYINRKKYSVQLMTKIFKINRSSYYKWLKNKYSID